MVFHTNVLIHEWILYTWCGAARSIFWLQNSYNVWKNMLIKCLKLSYLHFNRFMQEKVSIYLPFMSRIAPLNVSFIFISYFPLSSRVVCIIVNLWTLLCNASILIFDEGLISLPSLYQFTGYGFSASHSNITFAPSSIVLSSSFLLNKASKYQKLKRYIIFNFYLFYPGSMLFFFIWFYLFNY